MGLFSTWPSVKKKAQPSPCSYHPPQVTHWIDLSQGEIRASPQFIIIFYLSSLMQFLPGWVCCEKVEWNQAFHFAAKWDRGKLSGGREKPSSLERENVQRRVFIGCCPASQLGWLRQTVVLLYGTVYPVSLSHCFFLWASFISSVVLPNLFAFSVRLSVSILLYTFFGLPPTESPIKFPRVLHNGPAPPALHFSHDVCIPFASRCPCPSPADSSMAHGLFNSKAEFLPFFPLLPLF